MKITGAEIVIESLKREGVKHIFGYPGGVVLNLFDLFYDEKDLKLILTRHDFRSAQNNLENVTVKDMLFSDLNHFFVFMLVSVR